MSRARTFRESIHSCEVFRKFDFTSDSRDFYEYLKLQYHQIKNETSKDDLLVDVSLFLFSVGLFAFGQLDVAEDILDNIPKYPVSHLAAVLNILLPLPANLSYRTPNEFREWLIIKSVYLKWNAREERYILENFKIRSGISRNDNLKKFYYSSDLCDSYGLIVEIFKDDRTSWQAGFQGGNSELSGVYPHPNNFDLIAIARGKIYIVNPEQEQISELFGDNVYKIFEIIDSQRIIFFEDTKIFCYDSLGFLWRNTEIDWGKVRQLDINDSHQLEGEFFSDRDNSWIPFWLSTEIGKLNKEKFSFEKSFPLPEKQKHSWRLF